MSDSGGKRKSDYQLPSIRSLTDGSLSSPNNQQPQFSSHEQQQRQRYQQQQLQQQQQRYTPHLHTLQDASQQHYSSQHQQHYSSQHQQHSAFSENQGYYHDRPPQHCYSSIPQRQQQSPRKQQQQTQQTQQRQEYYNPNYHHQYPLPQQQPSRYNDQISAPLSRHHHSLESAAHRSPAYTSHSPPADLERSNNAAGAQLYSTQHGYNMQYANEPSQSTMAGAGANAVPVDAGGMVHVPRPQHYHQGHHPPPPSHEDSATMPSSRQLYYQQQQQQLQHPQTMAHHHNHPSSHFAQSNPLPTYSGGASSRQSSAALRDDAYLIAHHPTPTNAVAQSYSPPRNYHPQPQQQQQYFQAPPPPPLHPGISHLSNGPIISPTSRIGNAIEHMSIGAMVTSTVSASANTVVAAPPAVPPQPSQGSASSNMASVLSVAPSPASRAALKTDSQSGASGNGDDQDKDADMDADGDADADADADADEALMKRRKRNAQSAARLRERRKNREQELTHSCKVLESQISQLENELDDEKRRAMTNLRSNSNSNPSSTTLNGSVSSDTKHSSIKSVKSWTKRQLTSQSDGLDDVTMGELEGSTENTSTNEESGPRKRSRPLRELDQVRLNELKSKVATLGMLNQKVCINLGVLRQEIQRISQAVILLRDKK
ncbi:hypothetical protein EDC05_002153 [Coemansia umbellata]|uniref:BZIP domain-containing protein n=1 Tax=Coemansia umbellata TaxID=1424467 RepID=A0ABQ8PPW3_9FUNG|nr:hypothetical protein EDC05_002153 [Coemansia umbellata]